MPVLQLKDGREVEFKTMPTQEQLDVFLSDVSKQSRPKPQFATIQEAQEAMKNARIQQRIAEYNAAGINPYLNAIAPTVAGAAATTMLAPVVGTGILGSALAGGAGGAIQGALSPAENAGERTFNTAFNAATGAAFGGALSAAGKGIKAVTDIYKANKSLPPKQQIDAGIQALEQQRKTTLDAINLESQQNTINSSKIQQAQNTDKAAFDYSMKKLSTSFKATKDDITKKITDVSGKTAGQVKENVVRLFRDASSAYGKVRDEIFERLNDPNTASSVLGKNASPITKKEFIDTAGNILNQYKDDPAIANSASYKQLSDMLSRYADNAVPENLDFKQVIGDIRNFNKSTFSSGSGKAISSDELVAAKFNYAIGDLIKERVPEFAKLQTSYKPVMESKELAYRIFHPNNNLKTNQAQALFKRIATKDATLQDKQLISLMQEGFDVGGTKVRGMGYITKELDDIASQMAKLGKDFNKSKEVLKAKADVNIKALSDVSTRLVNDFRDNKLAKTKEVIGLDKRLTDLKDMLSKRNEIDQVKRQMLLKGAGLVGAGTAAGLWNAMSKRNQSSNPTSER